MTGSYDRFLHSLNFLNGPSSGVTFDKRYSTGNSRSKNALALGGGSLKGCFQAGAIKAVLEAGFIPDVIYGVSVGSLNGAFLVNAAGKKYISKKSRLTIGDWREIGSQLMDFWFKQICKPGVVTIEKGVLENAFRALLPVTNEAARKKAEQMLDLDIMRAAPVKMKVGTVDPETNEMVYKSTNDASFINYLESSFALPVSVTSSIVSYKKGLSDEEAENMLTILCDNKSTDTAEGSFNMKKLKHLVVRPEEELNIQINNYTSVDIIEHIMMGYEAGKRIFNSKPVAWIA